jgi:PAS domain S-box-containing protein
MNPQSLTAFYLYLSAAILAFIFMAFLFLQQTRRNTYYLNLVMGGMMIWGLGAAFAILTVHLKNQFDWYKVSQAGSIWFPLAWFFFVLRLISSGRQPNRRLRVLLTSIPVMMTCLVVTNDLHGWFWKLDLPSDALNQGFSHPVMLGPTGLFNLVYGLLMPFTAVLLILRKAVQTRGSLFLKQSMILIICTLLIPAGLLVNAVLPYERNIASLPALMANLTAFFFMIGAVRYRLIELVPLRYENVTSGLRSIILVINPENQIIHANHLASELIGKPAHELVGQSIEQALAKYPSLLEYCCKNEILTDISLETGDGVVYYELHVSQLPGRQKYPNGRLVAMRDITKRVVAENASWQSRSMLKQSEEKYRTLIENINEVIFTVNVHGEITYISPSIERYIGYSPEAVIGKLFSQFVFPDDLPALEVNVRHALAGNVKALEFRIVDREGNVRYVNVTSRLIMQDDIPVGLQGVITDITDRQQIETALERRAAQLVLLNHIGEQIASEIDLSKLLDSAAQVIQTNFGYYHVAIFTPNPEQTELRMRSASGSFSALFPGDHHLKYDQGMVGWTAAHKSMTLSNDVRLEPRYTNLYPNKIFTRSELAVPILIGDKLLGVLDIQSPLENAFDDNDVRVMRTVAYQIAIAIENASLYDEARHQLLEREKKENMLRIQRDLLVSLSLAKSLEDTLQTAVEIIAGELRASQVTISWINWENHTIQPVVCCGCKPAPSHQPLPMNGGIDSWVAQNSQPVLYPDGNLPPGLEVRSHHNGIICVPLISRGQVTGIISVESSDLNAFNQDDLRLLTTLANSLVILIERARLFEEVEKARTELENRATELEEANKNLRELDRLKSQFLANMSHELRTPLNSVIGFSEVLVDQLNGPLNTDQVEFAQDILDSGKHLLALINDLLDFSKIEAGRMGLEASTFDVTHLFNELRITISALVEKKSQVLVFRQEGENLCLTVDHLRIKQVFLNLLGNAIKFTPEGGTITVACRKVEPGWLLFSVQDTGIGIRPEDHELIFEEFRQVDGSFTREVSGTGLGLSISKRIVEMHNGRIWVESSLGAGSTFYIFIPTDCSSIIAENLS